MGDSMRILIWVNGGSIIQNETSTQSVTASEVGTDHSEGDDDRMRPTRWRVGLHIETNKPPIPLAVEHSEGVRARANGGEGLLPRGHVELKAPEGWLISSKVVPFVDDDVVADIDPGEAGRRCDVLHPHAGAYVGRLQSRNLATGALECNGIQSSTKAAVEAGDPAAAA
jgi:hypothetical protein